MGTCRKVQNLDLHKSFKFINFPEKGCQYYSCYQCTDSFTDGSSFKSHLRTCLKENPYPSTQCKKSYSSHHTLLQHIKEHAGENPFQCSLCTKSSSQNGN